MKSRDVVYGWFPTNFMLTLEYGINIGLRLLFFEKKMKEKKKNDYNALID